jgi:hypothetical protein
VSEPNRNTKCSAAALVELLEFPESVVLEELLLALAELLSLVLLPQPLDVEPQLELPDPPL